MNTETQTIIGPQASAREFTGRYLTHHLAVEEFGIDIMKVREIIGLVPITQVPTAPDYCRGVINPRGKVIPTIDLRLKLGIQTKEDTDRTFSISVGVQGKNGQSQFGFVVDEVAEVLDIAGDNINPTPEHGASFEVALIHGIGVVDGEVKILLDIDRVLAEEALRTHCGGLHGS